MPRRFLPVALLILCVATPCSAGQAQPQGERVRIDARGSVTPFPHFWERMFGSGRAILSLRESYRRDLRAVKQITGFDYVRFHGILLDEVGLYSEDLSGKPVCNFSYIDQIYDGLLRNGVRPFVELSFMPKELASTPVRQAFSYHPYVSPPKDWNRWGDMIERFARHLVARYGIREVSQWYFEVWNEPNIDFWAGDPKQATYYRLYDVTARALKRVNPLLRVGGPATAQAAWVASFIAHCVHNHVPLDFISTHVYANDTARDVFGTNELIPRHRMVCRAVRKVHDEIKGSARPELPLIWSEYNASYKNEVDVTDSAFMGPWLATTISQCDGLADMMSYWTFSDVFEEQGVVKKPFYGGFGLIAAGHIPKASYNAFELLHRLGRSRLHVDSDSVLATRRRDGSLAIAAWNYAPAGAAGEEKRVVLVVDGFPGRKLVKVSTLDDHHGSALDAWRAMGSPRFPLRDQQQKLRDAAMLAPGRELTLPVSGSFSIPLDLPPHALALVQIAPRR